MPRFKTRANEIEAVQVLPENKVALKELIGEKGDLRPYLEHDFTAVVETPHGVKVGFEGDYVHADINGLHVSRKDAFETAFEPVEEDTSADEPPVE